MNCDELVNKLRENVALYNKLISEYKDELVVVKEEIRRKEDEISQKKVGVSILRVDAVDIQEDIKAAEYLLNDYKMALGVISSLINYPNGNF